MASYWGRAALFSHRMSLKQIKTRYTQINNHSWLLTLTTVNVQSWKVHELSCRWLSNVLLIYLLISMEFAYCNICILQYFAKLHFAAQSVDNHCWHMVTFSLFEKNACAKSFCSLFRFALKWMSCALVGISSFLAFTPDLLSALLPCFWLCVSLDELISRTDICENLQWTASWCSSCGRGGKGKDLHWFIQHTKCFYLHELV